MAKRTDENQRVTCILPIRNENKTNPKVDMKTANIISPIPVLVWRFWPRELRKKKQSNSFFLFLFNLLVTKMGKERFRVILFFFFFLIWWLQKWGKRDSLVLLVKRSRSCHWIIKFLIKWLNSKMPLALNLKLAMCKILL